MSEKDLQTPHMTQPKLETALLDLYTAPAPSPAFARRLRAQLVEQAAVQRPHNRLARFWTGLTAAARWGLSLAGAALLVGLVVLGARLLPLLLPAKANQPVMGGQLTPTAAPSAAMPRLSPRTCANGITPTPPAPLYHGPGILLGGGSVTSGDYTVDLWLFCDNDNYRADGTGKQASGIQGLGIHTGLFYHGAQQNIESGMMVFTGIEPDLEPMGGLGAVKNGTGWTTDPGIFPPPGALNDGSADHPLRYMIQLRDPQGNISGGALDFHLRREADGYTVTDIQITPLNENQAAPTAAARVTPRLSPSACAAPVTPPASPGFTQRPPGLSNAARLIGGGTVASGSFTFDLWLECSDSFTKGAGQSSNVSEIPGLGIFSAWAYDGPALDGFTTDFSGLEPYVIEHGTSGPSLSKGLMGFGETGIQAAPGVYPDWSGSEFSLRYILKIRDPQSGFHGAALSFKLIRQADGFIVTQIQASPLSEAELAQGDAPSTAAPPFPILDPASVDPLLGELKVLRDRQQAELTSSPGWMHFRTHMSQQESGGTLPNGAEIPKEYDMDEWYQVGAAGQVVAAVTRMIDGNGKETQVSIAKDGTWYNLTLGSQSPASFSPPPVLDFGFYTNAANAITTGSTLTSRGYSEGGAYQGELYTLTLTATREEILVDPKTGHLLSYTSSMQNGNKDWKVISSAKVLALERLDQPPAEILALLNQTIASYKPLDPQGAPAPSGYDPSHSKLTSTTIAGDNPDFPTFWYGDIYAQNNDAASPYLLGRVDFGGVPGGYCQRSVTGLKLAYRYSYPLDKTNSQSAEAIRWVDLRDLARVHNPAPDLRLVSPLAWSPMVDVVGFFACHEGEQDCKFYTLTTENGSDQAADQINASELTARFVSQLFWEPNGAPEIAYVAQDKDGPVFNLYVVDLTMNKVLYKSPVDPNHGPVPADAPVKDWNITIGADAASRNCFTQP